VHLEIPEKEPHFDEVSFPTDENARIVHVDLSTTKMIPFVYQKQAFAETAFSGCTPSSMHLGILLCIGILSA
jgi:hypothetical protein